MLPKFHPGFMPAKKALAEIELNFAVEGHVTAVTFPDGNAGTPLAAFFTRFSQLTYPGRQRGHLGVKLLRAPARTCSEPFFVLGVPVAQKDRTRWSSRAYILVVVSLLSAIVYLVLAVPTGSTHRQYGHTPFHLGRRSSQNRDAQIHTHEQSFIVSNR